MYNQLMPKDVIHISEAEAAAINVATLLAHVRAGAEVVIEKDARPVAVLRSAEPHPGRLRARGSARLYCDARRRFRARPRRDHQ